MNDESYKCGSCGKDLRLHTKEELKKCIPDMDVKVKEIENVSLDFAESKLFEQRLTENGLGLAERARNQGRKIVDQYVHEKTELGKLIAEKRNKSTLI